MLLQKIRENYDALMQIGIEAREAGRKIGLKPSCAESDQAPAKAPRAGSRRPLSDDTIIHADMHYSGWAERIR